MQSEVDPRDIFLKGRHVFLKVLTRDDVINSGWYGWFNDEDLCSTLQKHYFPIAMESQIEYWERNIKNAKDRLQLGICRVEGGGIVGVVSLNNIDYINRKAEFSAVIGDRTAQNVVIFIESCRLLINHGFYSLNLNRIYGGSVSQGLVQTMCRMLDFQEEGVRRQDVFKNGKYIDVYCYGILKADFPSISLVQ